MIYLISIIYY